MADNQPPPYQESIPTLYDETHRGIWHPKPAIMSQGAVVSLIAHLEHYPSTTDGSFAICIASGQGNFISKQLYESIPQDHRPSMKATIQSVDMMLGGDQKALGTTFVPLLLKNADTGKRFRVVLQAYVMENLSMGMFISQPHWIPTWQFEAQGMQYNCDFRNGERIKLMGEPF